MSAEEPTIALIPGDGIGKEVVPAAVRVMDAAVEQVGFAVNFEHYPLGADHYLETGDAMPDDTFERLKSSSAIFLGALGDPRVPDSAHARDILLGTRRRLDLFINFRPVQLISAALSPLKNATPEDLDLVIFRENTEGLYAGAGGSIHPDSSDEVATETMIATRHGIDRILKAAFEYAKGHDNLRVCMVDKSNALRNVGDLWMRAFEAMNHRYPDIETRHLYVDAAAMELVREPGQFDVIVTSNLFGDILSDLAAMLVGGMGLATSANLNPERPGLYEPVHGSAPDIAGQGIANPTAAILTGALMLEHLGAPEAATRINRAVSEAVVAGECTRDIGGELNTAGMTEAVINRLR